MKDKQYKAIWQELKEEIIRVWVKEKEELDTIYKTNPENDSFYTGVKDGYQVGLKHVLNVMDIKDDTNEFANLLSDLEDE